jgi:protein-tyrosine phosphatase
VTPTQPRVHDEDITTTLQRVTVGQVTPLTAPSAVSLDARHRHIPLEAVHNLRDLGGYPTSDGGTTRWGVTYRADGVYRATEADRAVLLDLGIRAIVDLRTDVELAERGTLSLPGAKFLHAPMVLSTWAHHEGMHDVDTVDFLVERTGEMLVEGAPQLARIFDVLSGDAPALFHCAAGKDRTGIVATLVLSALGVADDVIAEDYALTAAGMVRMRAWFAETQPEGFTSVMENPPPAFIASPPEVMLRVLEQIRVQFGSVHGYLASTGVTSDLVDRLRTTLVEY